MKSTTRQHILEYIQSKEVACAAEISRALHMTAANARHHLSSLKDEGVVTVIGQRPSSGRGRPVDLYRLTLPLARHNLDGLANALLLELLERTDRQVDDGLLEKLATRLLAEGLPTSKNLTQRLSQAVQRLNRMNYQARWEANVQGPRVIFQHCPYAAIIGGHPEICQMDQLMLKNMLNLPVQQLAKLEMAPSGIPQCVFRLGL